MRPRDGPNQTSISGQRLILPVELEDGRVPDMFARLTYVVSAFVLAAILWGSFAEIRELAIAHGKVIPAGTVRPVQHLEGGEVEAVLVREGQLVEKGAPLVNLRPVTANSDLGQLSARFTALKLQRETLTALIESRQPDFGELGKKYPALIAEQRQVYVTKKRHREQERDALIARVSQRAAELAAVNNELASLERQVAIQSEQTAIRQELLNSGYTSRRAYLDAESSLEQVKSRLFAAQGRQQSTSEQLVEAKSQLQASTSDAVRALSEERSKIAGELAELKQQVAKHQDRVDRLVVRAPVGGVVQELPQRAPGEVIKPGDLVASLVPVDHKIVAEVRVEPTDIGHVKVGDIAEIKVTTFDSAVFGVVKGTVSHLSPSTFTTEDGAPYYKAIVSLDQDFVGQEAAPRRILPGMVVQADIITGAKSLVRYLLKPVYRSLNAGFTER